MSSEIDLLQIRAVGKSSSGLVDSPNERTLIIYGAGHLAWLRRNFSCDPTLQLRKLAEFANYAGVSK